MIQDAICGVSRGGYIKPVPMTEMNFQWEDEDGNPIDTPLKYACEHDNHWNWGKGTRNGQKLYYPLEEMFYQKWKLTDKEMKEAIEEYDIFSLEMRGRIICKNRAKKETNQITNK